MVPTVLLVVASFLLSVEAGIFSHHLCVPCRGEHCNVEPADCKYGVVTVCGKKVCGKGPGERCGGYQDIRGKCGTGLVCDDCGFCMGCFVSSVIGEEMECFRSDASRCFI